MPTCIPYAFGVPGLGAPPNWWDTTIPSTQKEKYDDRLEDPRWRGAYGQGFGTGVAEETMFRALCHTDTTGNQSLYLSWHVKYDAASSPNQDMLYVGCAADAAAQPLILQIVVYAADPVGGITADNPASIQAGTRDASGHFQALADEPDWVATTTRVWRNPTLGQWAVQMKVPINTGASLGDDAGIDIDPTTTFRMWYCYDIYTPTNAGGGAPAGGILRLHYPTTATFGFSGGQKVYPAPSAYDTCELGSSSFPSCPGGSGISLDYLNVGTTNVPASEIDVNNPNTIFARPTNNTGASVAAHQIKARFAIANWGSIADPAAPWTDIATNEDNSAAIPDGTIADASNDIRFVWSVPLAMKTDFTNGVKSTHQCMLVELSGAGLVFSNASVYRNMNFEGASKFTREAEISVLGLRAISSRPRDVYLAVETINMPGQVGRQPERTHVTHRELGMLTSALAARDDDDRSLLERITDYINSFQFNQEKGITPATLQQQLDSSLPTYRVHCYHDTGKREVIGGKEYVILGLQSAFGYYAIHEGELVGWSHHLRGAIRLAENFYVLRVPNNGATKIATTIQAVQPGEPVEPEEPILPRWPQPEEPDGCDLLRRIIRFLKRLIG
ncbi:MAG: hypothetical protein JW918_12590 [Anaerolineae bacterium]|nr:hypothetical protein [Anaerolineae bacterium]